MCGKSQFHKDPIRVLCGYCKFSGYSRVVLDYFKDGLEERDVDQFGNEIFDVWDDADSIVHVCPQCGQEVFDMATLRFLPKKKINDFWTKPVWEISLRNEARISVRVQSRARWMKLFAWLEKRGHKTGFKGCLSQALRKDKVVRIGLNIHNQRLERIKSMAKRKQLWDKVTKDGHKVTVSPEVARLLNKGFVLGFTDRHVQAVDENPITWTKWTKDKDHWEKEVHLRRNALREIRSWTRKGGDLKELHKILKVSDDLGEHFTSDSRPYTETLAGEASVKGRFEDVDHGVDYEAALMEYINSISVEELQTELQ